MRVTDHAEAIRQKVEALVSVAVDETFPDFLIKLGSAPLGDKVALGVTVKLAFDGGTITTEVCGKATHNSTVRHDIECGSIDLAQMQLAYDGSEATQ